MGLFKDSKKVGMISDVIRCEKANYLIWKWHPDGTSSGEHKREYAIRNGARLHVREGEVAVFVYKQKGGVFNDYVSGPFEEKLKTKNLPIIGGIIDAFWGGDTPFQAEVYFINTAKNVQVKFGVPYFDVADARMPDFTVPVAVRGSINFKIEDYKEFVKLYRLADFSVDDFSVRIRDSVVRYVKNVVTNIPAIHSIPVIQLERRITAVNQIVELNLKKTLFDTFGVTVTEVDVTDIEIDKSSDEYRELMAVTRDITTAGVKARADADNEDYLESKRIKREEDAYARHMRTKSENLAAYTVEEGARVGVAGADALGEIGASGAGSVSIGGASFSPAGMVAGMALGSVVGEGVSGVVRTAMSGIATAGAETPPPVPSIAFYVAKDGVATGPFDMVALSAMVASGALRADTLVWKSGMAAWEKAGSVAELSALFPPAIPK